MTTDTMNRSCADERKTFMTWRFGERPEAYVRGRGWTSRVGNQQTQSTITAQVAGFEMPQPITAAQNIATSPNLNKIGATIAKSARPIRLKIKLDNRSHMTRV